MKRSLFAVLMLILLALPLLGGCGLVTLGAELEAIAAERISNQKLEAAAAEVTSETTPEALPSTPTSVPAADSIITEDEAAAAALTHAGLTADEVSRLRVELDRDDGRLQYEVQFDKGHLEYEYDIHAGTGKILSFEMDD